MRLRPKRSLKRSLLVQRLLDREMLAGDVSLPPSGEDPATPALIGVDFDPSGGGTTPTNWTRVESITPGGQTFGDLIDESGAATAVDLTLTTTPDAVDFFFDQPLDPATLPVHTQSLAGVDGFFYPESDDGTITATFSDLQANAGYAVFVFGSEEVDFLDTLQITIRGAGDPVVFVQENGENFLQVNDQPGSVTRPLSTLGKIIRANAAGQIEIQFQRIGGDSITLSALAIQPVTEMDFGDAPINYPVTRAQDGARHAAGTLLLGNQIDFELDGQPSETATADSTTGVADEEGVLQVTSLVSTTAAETTASFSITASAAGRLDAWIDFDQDGTWEAGDEQIYASIPVVAGINVLPFQVPSQATSGSTFARFRLSSSGGLTPTGPALDGEVEDHPIRLLAGDLDAGVTVVVDPPTSGNFELTSNGLNLAVQSDNTELFAAPASSLRRIDLFGTTSDDTIQLSDWPSSFTGIVGGTADGGQDTLILTNPETSLSLASIAMTSLEVVDVTVGATLEILAADVLAIQPVVKQMRVERAAAGKLVFSEPWVVEPPRFVAGQLTHFGTAISAGEAVRLEVTTDTAWTNPFQAADVDGNGNTQAFDALRVINSLNRAGSPRFPIVQPTNDDEVPAGFQDVNADGVVDAVDALAVINRLNRLNRVGAGETQGETRSAIRYAPAMMTLGVPLHASPGGFDADPIEAFAFREPTGVQAETDRTSRPSEWVVLAGGQRTAPPTSTDDRLDVEDKAKRLGEWLDHAAPQPAGVDGVDNK